MNEREDDVGLRPSMQIEKLDNDIDGYMNESRLLQQATQKLEKQLTSAHAQNESLQRTFHQNELSYQEKVNDNLWANSIVAFDLLVDRRM